MRLVDVKPDDIDPIGSFYSDLKHKVKNDRDTLVVIHLSSIRPDGRKDVVIYRIDGYNLEALIEMTAEDLAELRSLCPPTGD